MKFIIPGTPVAKGRPRLGKFGTYTPKKTVQYENLVQLAYMEQVNMPPTDKALDMEIKLYFPIPKSYTKKKKEDISAGKLKFTKKPDLDNCMKTICDALNGIAYIDDSQIYQVAIYKAYAVEPEMPRAEVIITEIN